MHCILVVCDWPFGGETQKQGKQLHCESALPDQFNEDVTPCNHMKLLQRQAFEGILTTPHPPACKMHQANRYPEVTVC